MTQDNKRRKKTTSFNEHPIIHNIEDRMEEDPPEPQVNFPSVNPQAQNRPNTIIANSTSSFGFDTAIEMERDKHEEFSQPLTISDYRPFRLSEIIPGTPWPDNLQQLVRDPTSRGYDPKCPKFVTLAEITALLCHAALVEVGFVPENPEITPLSLFTLPDSERIRRLGGRVSASGYNSAATIFTWRYQVVNAISENTKESQLSEDGTGKVCEKQDVKINIEDCKKTSLNEEGEKPDVGVTDLDFSAANLLSSEESEIVRYEFSPPCNIIMVPKDAGVQIFCNFPGSLSTKPFQLTVDVDIRASMENNTHGLESIRQAPDEWMRMMNLNGVSFSSSFKRKFATFCLDAMNGVMFELRGLVCLPPEILIQIFSQCDIKTIRNIRLTCRYLNDVGNIPGLWRILIKRDFGSQPSVPAARFARFFSRIPYELSPNVLDAQNDYKSIYEAQRRVNFRPRFDIVGGGISNRLAPRHSWLPYVTPPRPYLFRVSYDVPPQSSLLTTPHNLNRQFFQNF